MGKKGGRKQQKRISSPRIWPIFRKEAKWTAKPRAGPHGIQESLTLLILVRDVLQYCDSYRETKRILSEGTIKVDGVVRRDHKFPVGLMDVVEVTKLNKFYRILPLPKRGLRPVPIDGDETSYKLVQIENKVTVKEGHLQLNLHDGRNILFRLEDPKISPDELVPYKTKDTLKISIPNQEILGHIPFKEENLAIVVDGKNMGFQGKIKEIIPRFGPHASVVSLKGSDGTIFETALEYVFPVGENEPEIRLVETVLES
ncbi:MAG: 30S ribosomal protein S4e [Candidatus Jordarchaeum sp.]|uniref:30S ribosomal protein S4e n=1 Tax=Candidatus Jordarchaeum sp. TaxID=2823881 RepID=UPI00404B9A6C